MVSNDAAENRELVEKYPFLAIRDGETEYSWYEDIPDGWRKAFGSQMIKELNDLLILASKRDGIDWTREYEIDDVKEKWGYPLKRRVYINEIKKVKSKIKILSYWM